LRNKVLPRLILRRVATIVNALQLLLVQAHGHAQFAQIAVGAGDFDGWCHGTDALGSR
jgi:hypothetical protein